MHMVNYNKEAQTVTQYAESYVISHWQTMNVFYYVFKHILFFHVFSLFDIF